MPSEYRSSYHPPEPTNHLATRMSTLSLGGYKERQKEESQDTPSQDPYQEFLYRHHPEMRRPSSTGEASGESSPPSSEGGSEGGGSEPGDETGNSGMISDDERRQVEAFFKGLKTEVYVCTTLANLYLRTPQSPEWTLHLTGVPAVILDTGGCRARRGRRIQFALAERGTGFMLWSDIVDNLTDYRVAGPAFHTMCYSQDHTVIIGLSYDDADGARELWEHLERLVGDPENIKLSTPGKKKKKERKQPKPPPLPPKSHISQPCCFQHVTSIEREDTNRYFSLKEFLPRSPPSVQRTQSP